MKKIFENILLYLKKAGVYLKEKVTAPGFVKRALTLIISLAVVACSAGVAVLVVSTSVKASVKDRLITEEEVSALEDVDLVLVLGAGLRSDGSPSDMLADRLRVGVSLVDREDAPMMLLSGDNSGEHYNEVAAMKKFAVENGVDEKLILTDGKGFSTYESISRAITEYGAEKIVIVTQEYHLYRAIYVAKALGIEAYGVSADLRTYRGQFYRDIREHFARFKDFLITIEKD